MKEIKKRLNKMSNENYKLKKNRNRKRTRTGKFKGIER